MIKNKKLVAFGALVGLIGPVIALLLFHYFRFSQTELMVFVERLMFAKFFGPVMSLCVLINLLLFFSFIWLKRDEGAWGVLFTTFLYAILVFWLKLFA